MSMDPSVVNGLKRRAFLSRSAGLGVVALNSLLNPALLSAQQAAAAADPARKSLGAVNPLQFAPKAKRVIYLYQAGGPSHLETFDYKPALAKLDGQPMPESFTKGQQLAQLAIQWSLRDPRVTSLVLGASSVKQLDTNLDALQGPPLTEEELAEIDQHAVESDGVNLWAEHTEE